MSAILPTVEQQKGLNDLVAMALIEMRLLSRQEGVGEQIHDLADAFHNIPREMYGWGAFNWKTTRGLIQHYQDRHHSREYSGRVDYLSLLDRIARPDYVHEEK